MTILRKPYKREDYVKLIEECNKTGEKRVEIHNGDAFALFSYETVQNGEIVDLRGTDEYEAEQKQIAKEKRMEEIQEELNFLDQKRIRAICEPSEIREDGKSWLEYYNEQICILREELNSL